MNRCALAIQMLHILYGRNTPIQKKELSRLLETNPRNIIELKKELETAGYLIESTTGKYGGYRLKEEGIFPSLALSKEETHAVQEAAQYLQGASGFAYDKDFVNAVNKLNAKLRDSERAKTQTIYLNGSSRRYQEEENEMLMLLQKAKNHCYEIRFQYCSLQNDLFFSRTVQPYEIVANEEGMYVLAYDLTKGKKKEFKFFKITKERMCDVVIEKRHFVRDMDFRIEDHTGKHALFKDMHEVELEVQGMHARLLLEKGVENLLSSQYKNGVLHLRFMMEGNLRILQFVLSMGKDCTVIAPKSLRDQVFAECEAILRKKEKEM